MTFFSEINYLKVIALHNIVRCSASSKMQLFTAAFVEYNNNFLTFQYNENSPTNETLSF